MKKLNFIKPIMIGATLATPMTALASCSKEDFSRMAEQLKTDQIDEFISLSKTRRPTFACGEIFQYIKDKMQSYGFNNPTGYDNITMVQEYKDKIKSELNNDHGQPDGSTNDFKQLALLVPTVEDAYVPYGNI